MGEELSTRFKALTATQKKLGDFFSEMSLKSTDLQDEFSYNADTQVCTYSFSRNNFSHDFLRKH